MKLPGCVGMNGEPQTAAGTLEGKAWIERMVEALDACTGMSAEDRAACALAIRVAYGVGFEDGRGLVRRAA